MSKDAYWFRHDSNANRDPKIMMMKSVYGFEGYGLYWAIVEALREQEGYRLKIGGKFGLVPLSGMVQYDATKLKEFVNDCVNEFELFQIKGDFLECISLVKRMKKWEANKANGKKGGRPPKPPKPPKDEGPKKPKENPPQNPNETQEKPNPKPTEKPPKTIEIIEDKIIEDNSTEEESTEEEFAHEKNEDKKNYSGGITALTTEEVEDWVAIFKTGTKPLVIQSDLARAIAKYGKKNVWEQTRNYIRYKELADEKKHKPTSFLQVSENPGADIPLNTDWEFELNQEILNQKNKQNGKSRSSLGGVSGKNPHRYSAAIGQHNPEDKL